MILIHTGVLPEQVMLKEGVELQSPNDYPQIRLDIRKALDLGQDCHIYIRHRACDGWFWDLSDYCGVMIVNDDPREQLKRKLQAVALPPDLNSYPEWIIALGLLDLPDPEAKLTDVWAWILNRKLGLPWSTPKPSFVHLGSVGEWYLNNSPLLAELPNPLKQKQRAVINQWLSRAEGELKLAYELFFKNPAKNSIFINCWQNLESYYADDIEHWLKEEGCYTPTLAWGVAKLPRLPLHSQVENQLSPKARACWNGRLEKEHLKLDEALSQMSGLLSGELKAIQDSIYRGIIKVDRLQVGKLALKFATLPSIESVVNSILTQLPPNEPSEPDPDWTEDAWINWAVREYTPYKKWLIDHDQDSTKASRYSLLYEDWLFANYPNFIQRFDCLVYGSFKHIESALSDGSAVVWVLIDNLPLFWNDTLNRILSEAGFLRPNTPVCLLSMLPSETSVSRVSAILGKLPCQVKDIDTEQFFEEEWKGRGVEARISHSGEELSKHVAEDGDLFLLIYNDLDYLAHQPDHELTNREEIVEFQLRRLSESLKEVIRQVAEVRPVKLVISSDHGSTKIPSSAQNLSIPPSAQVSETFRQHSRFVRVSHFNALNALEWFFLEGQKFGLQEKYAVAKGARYVGARPTGYTHGGLSPEETLTALSVWQLGKISPEAQLSVFHSSSPILRGRLQPLAVTIRNSFSFDVVNLDILVPSVGAHFKAERIFPQTEVVLGPVEIRLPPKLPTTHGISLLDMVISYEVAGCIKQQVKPPLEVKIRELFRSELADIETMLGEV